MWHWVVEGMAGIHGETAKLQPRRLEYEDMPMVDSWGIVCDVDFAVWRRDTMTVLLSANQRRIKKSGAARNHQGKSRKPRCSKLDVHLVK